MTESKSTQSSSGGAYGNNRHHENSSNQPSENNPQPLVTQQPFDKLLQNNLYIPNATEEFAQIVDILTEAFAEGEIEGMQRAVNALVRAADGTTPKTLGSDDAKPIVWQEQLYTMMNAFEPRPPRKWVAQDFLAAGTLTMMYGAPGVKKSMAMMDLAMSVALGLSWLPDSREKPETGRATTQMNTLWYDCDNGRDRCDERFSALARARGLPNAQQPISEVPLFYVSMPSPLLNLREENWVDDLSGLIKKHQIELMFIDNLTAISGEADENSEQMAPIMLHLRQLVERTGITCVPIHHVSKDRNTFRGSSSILAAVDDAFLVEPGPGQEDITFKARKARGNLVLPFSARFWNTQRPDKSLETAGFFVLGTAGANRDADLEQAILEVVRENKGINQSKLKNLVNAKIEAPDQKITQVTKRLADEKRLTVTIGGRNAHLYSLPD